MRVHSVWDAGDEFADRYTVYYQGRGATWPAPGVRGRVRQCLCMGRTPFHPQGFCQHASGVPGKHNGKRIAFEDLPEDCQKAVKQDIGG